MTPSYSRINTVSPRGGDVSIRAPDKRSMLDKLTYFSMKTYVVTPH